MTATKSVKVRPRRYRIVAVITTVAELRMAAGMSRPPDLFEVRLDHLLDGLNIRDIRRLSAPIIVTARHPAEGGANNLSMKHRQELLLRFLPLARYIDVELRSAKHLQVVLDVARDRNVRRIISFHEFLSTPTLGSLRAKAKAARSFHPEIFKVVVRTDTLPQLGRLLRFVAETEQHVKISAMGVGKLGAISRILFTNCGSTLVYTSLRESRVEGQMSLPEFQRALRTFGLT